MNQNKNKKTVRSLGRNRRRHWAAGRPRRRAGRRAAAPARRRSLPRVNKDRGERAVKRIADNCGKAQFLRRDAIDCGLCNAAPKAITSSLGGPTVLVIQRGRREITRGCRHRLKFFRKIATVPWGRRFDINLVVGALLPVPGVGRVWPKRGAAASSHRQRVGPTPRLPVVAYPSLAKSAVLSLTRSSPGEWAPSGLRVNSITPASSGRTRTALCSTRPTARPTPLAPTDPPRAAPTPMGRFGDSSELIWRGGVSGRSRRAAGFVHGDIFASDGGFLSHNDLNFVGRTLLSATGQRPVRPLMRPCGMAARGSALRERPLMHHSHHHFWSYSPTDIRGSA